MARNRSTTEKVEEAAAVAEEKIVADCVEEVKEVGVVEDVENVKEAAPSAAFTCDFCHATFSKELDLKNHVC